MSSSTLVALVVLVLVLAVAAGLLAGRAVVRRAGPTRSDTTDTTDAALAAAVAELGAVTDARLREAVADLATVAGERWRDQHLASSSDADLRQQAFAREVAGVRAELERVHQLVGQLGRQGAEQQGSIVEALHEAARRTGELERTTDGLRQTLASSRARGQWGERIADDVLRAAGLVEGVSYRKQMTLAGGGRPDVTFLLPQDRLLHMDVKFPLDNYLRHLDAATDAERAATEQAFRRDVRARLRELVGRGYADPATTVGHVLVFIPNEAVYAFVHERDPGLLDEALAQGVVLCSPCTLFAVLAVVRHAVDSFALQQTSGEILDCLARFTHQWGAFTDALDRLGNQLATAQRTYDGLAGTRRRQLERQLHEVDRLRRDGRPSPVEPDHPAAGAGEPPGLRLAGS